MYTSNLYALKNAVNLRKKSKHIITKELLNKTWEIRKQYSTGNQPYASSGNKNKTKTGWN